MLVILCMINAKSFGIIELYDISVGLSVARLYLQGNAKTSMCEAGDCQGFTLFYVFTLIPLITLAVV